MSDVKVLICAPAVVRLMAPGSSFKYLCSKCATRVMVAPSGQSMIKDHPDTIILCSICYSKRAKPGDEITMAGDPGQVEREFNSAIPNTWKDRN